MLIGGFKCERGEHKRYVIFSRSCMETRRRTKESLQCCRKQQFTLKERLRLTISTDVNEKFIHGFSWKNKSSNKGKRCVCSLFLITSSHCIGSCLTIKWIICQIKYLRKMKEHWTWKGKCCVCVFFCIFFFLLPFKAAQHTLSARSPSDHFSWD